MRLLNQNSNAYANAVRAVGNLKIALKEELDFLTSAWKPSKGTVYIAWLCDEDVKELTGNGLYGSEEGMYLFDITNDGKEIEFYLPKTTEAYAKFHESLVEYCDDDDTLYFETIPNIIEVCFDGNNEVEIFIAVNVEGLAKEGYESAVKIVKTMVDMLMNTVMFEKISFKEGDIDFDKENSDHYVGVKIAYNLED